MRATVLRRSGQALARPVASRTKCIPALARLPRYFSAEAAFVPPEIAFEDWADFTASPAYAKARSLVQGGNTSAASQLVIESFPLVNGLACIVPSKLFNVSPLTAAQLSSVQPIVDRVLAGTKTGGDENDWLQRRTTDENRVLFSNLNEFVVRNFDILRKLQIDVAEVVVPAAPDRYDPAYDQWLAEVSAAEDAATRHIHSIPLSATLMDMFLKSDLAPQFASEVAKIESTYTVPMSTSFGKQLQSFFTTSPGVSAAVTFKSSGNASEAVTLAKTQAPTTCGASEVIVKMLAVPISRADLDAIEGAKVAQDMKSNSIFRKSFKLNEYVFQGGASANKPGTAGNYGIGLVMQVGSDVSRLQPGDFVTPFKSGLGTWSTDMVAKEADLAKLSSKSADVEALAVFAMNAVAATELLTSFVTLKKGDTIIQNGGETSLGMLVTQMAVSMGVKVINVIKPAPYYQEVHMLLMGLGSTAVLDERYLDKYCTRELMDDLGARPVLALDCVGGRTSGSNVGRALRLGGTLVVHGQSSGEPIVLPAEKKIKVEGFWVQKALAQYSLQKYEATINATLDLATTHHFAQWVERAELANFNRGLERAAAEDIYREVVLMPQAGLSAARKEAEQAEADHNLLVAEQLAPLAHAKLGLNEFSEKKFLGE